MNTSSVLLSGSSARDIIDVSNTSVSQPPKETKTEQSSSKSFKRALEEEDTKVPGSEGTKSGDTDTEVKEVKEIKKPEAEKEATVSSYVSNDEQNSRSEETDESPPLPMFTPIITALPEAETGKLNSLTPVDVWFQNVQTSVIPGTEENIKSGKSNLTDKTNTGNSGVNIFPAGLQVPAGNDILGYNFNVNTGNTEKSEISDPGTLLNSIPKISSPKSTEEGINLAGKAAEATRNETLNINSLLGRSHGGDQQSDLNREGREQQPVILKNEGLNSKIIAELTNSEIETKPVNVRERLNIQPREGELPQGEGKAVDVRQVQFSAAFSQRDTGMMLDDSDSGKAEDKPNFSTLKGAPQGGAETSAAISTSEMSKTDTKQPIHEVSAKVIEQVREPLVQAVKKGVDHIQLRLKPDGLGELRIDLRVQGGRLNMQILTDNVTTKHVLEFGLPDLKGHLSDSGISVGNANIEHDEGKGRDKNHAEHRENNPQGRNNNKKGNQSFREYFA